MRYKRQLVAALLVVLFGYELFENIRRAHGQPPPSDALELARACSIEAGWSEIDCAAIYYVIARKARIPVRALSADVASGKASLVDAAMSSRYGAVAIARVPEGSFRRMLRSYSALDAKNPRARRVARWPDGDIAGESDDTNAQWAQLRQLAKDLLAGKVADPCHADEWGAKSGHDLERGRRAIDSGKWVMSKCSARTKNAFYRHIGRRK